MPPLFDVRYAQRLQRLRDRLLPLLKGRASVTVATPAGSDQTPEPESPRPYAHGDDARAIDWNLYARLDRLFVRTTTREEAVPLLLLVDASASMAEPEPRKLRQAAAVAGAVADLALALGHPVGVVPWAEGPRRLFGPYAGEGELPAIFQALESLAPGGGSNLAATLAALHTLVESSRVSAIVLSDFLVPADFGRAVESLALRGSPVQAVRILDDEEGHYPLRGHLLLVDPETRREVRVRADAGLQRRYRRLFAEHGAAVSGIFAKAGAAPCAVSASEPFDAATERFFRERPGFSA
jgi:uncharacterized protein (DUF58 family)